MGKKSGSSKSSSSSRPVTRSRVGVSSEINNETMTTEAPTNRVADITYYTKVANQNNDGVSMTDGGFQVISKRKLKGNDPQNHERLQEGLAKVKKWELEHKHQRERNSQSAERDETDSLSSTLTANSSGGSASRTTTFVTHLNVFLYATCFFIQTGTLPYLTKKLGADPTVFGQLQTVFALAQLGGGPLYGRLGDLLGERVALIVAFTSAFISYSLMGIATSVQTLFASRLFSVLMHVMQGSQMIVTQLSNEAERTKDLARLGFSYGIGMVVGPSLGGLVTKHFGEQQSALLAASGSFLSIILVILFIPYIPRKPPSFDPPKLQEKKKTDQSKQSTTDQNESNDKTMSSPSAASVLNVKEILKLLFLPQVAILLLVKLASGIPIGILQSMFSVIAMEQFGLEADKTGMVLSYVGSIGLFMQGFGISLVTSRFADKSLLKFSTFTLTTAYGILALVRGLQDFLLLLLPLTCSMTLINSVITASLTKSVPKTSTGQMLGLNMAVHSAIRSVAPTIGGYLIATYGLLSLGGVGVICNLCALMILPFTKLRDKL